MNAKGVMDDVYFDDYLYNSLIPLYSDAVDVKGKMVLFKIDTGSGWLGVKFLDWLRLLGFVLYTSVPNTNAVSHKTHMNYGPFKTAFQIIRD